MAKGFCVAIEKCAMPISSSISQSTPIVFLHGFLGNQQDWQPLIDRLSGIECVAIELPGHGQNADDPLPDFDAFPDWLENQLASKGIDEFHLMGYSLGGRLALAYASQEPPGLKSLIIENAHSGLSHSEQRKQRQQSDEEWATRFESEPLVQVLIDWYSQPVFSDLDANEKKLVIADRLHNNGCALASALRKYSLSLQPDYCDWIKTTQLPMLYLCGTDDIKFQKLGDQLVKTAPQLTKIMLTGGHNLHRANPDGMASALIHWLNHIPLP